MPSQKEISEKKEIKDIDLDDFHHRFTFTSDKDPQNKIIMSNGSFAECHVGLLILKELRTLCNKNHRCPGKLEEFNGDVQFIF